MPGAASTPARRRWLWLAWLPILVLLPVLFFTVENWRGRRTWEACRRVAAARGERLDWRARLPAPAPDERNLLGAPLAAAWFTRGAQGGTRAAGAQPPAAPLGFFSHWPPALAELQTLAARATDSPDAETALGASAADPVLPLVEFTDCPLADALESLARQARLELVVDPVLRRPPPGAPGAGVPTVSARWENVTARRALAEVLRRHRLAAQADAPGRGLLVTLAPPSLAGLRAWFASHEAGFAQLRQECQRPEARLPLERDRPFSTGTPHFAGIRQAAEFLAARCKFLLLSGETDRALDDAALLRRLPDVCLGGAPTLEAAFARVAVANLGLDTLGEGLAASLWKPSQWPALQAHLDGLDLLAPLQEGLRGGERDAMIDLVERLPRGRLEELFCAGAPGGARASLSASERFYLRGCPRGWLEQNLATATRVVQANLATLDPAGHRIDVPAAEAAQAAVQREFGQLTPYNFLASLHVSQFYGRGLQVAARTQCLADQAAVACALERCRAQTGAYPERLEDLAPQWLAAVPQDLLDKPAQTLKYRRSLGGKYVLYSVGWNGQDEGGAAALTPDRTPSADLGVGDWVWPYIPRR